MSKYFGLLFLSSMLHIARAFAEGGTALQPEEGKLYITRKALRFVKNEIIVVKKESAFATPAVHSDEKGLYVNANELREVQSERLKEFRRFHHWKNKHGAKNGCSKKNGKKNVWKAEQKRLEQNQQK